MTREQNGETRGKRKHRSKSWEELVKELYRRNWKREENILAIDEGESLGILIIEVGSENDVYYCDSYGQYRDEVSNNKFERTLVDNARLDEIKGLYRYGEFEKISIEECYEKRGKA